MVKFKFVHALIADPLRQMEQIMMVRQINGQVSLLTLMLK